MASGKYYRTSNGMLGGVCAGLADYYQADVLPFRLVFLLLLAATLGLFGVVYVICVLVWPKHDKVKNVYEVRPHTVDSSAYGTLSADEIRHMGASTRRHRADAPRSVGHIPPVPPRCFVARYGEIAPFFTQRVERARGTAEMPSESRRDHVVERKRMSTRALILVLAGLFVLTLLLDYLACRFVSPVQPMQMFPVFFSLLGIAMLVVPSRRAFTAVRMADGAALVVLGGMGLAVSIGALSSEALCMPAVLFPLIAVVALLLVSARYRPRWLLALIVALTVVLVVVLMAYAQPGPVSQLQVQAPVLGTMVIPLR